MNQVLLVEDRMFPIPSNIKVLQDWDTVSIHAEIEGKQGFVRGKHMMLSGEAEAFKTWLKPFDGVWVGQGTPQLQQFTVMHVE